MIAAGGGQQETVREDSIVSFPAANLSSLCRNAKLPIADATRKREEAIKKREEIYVSTCNLFTVFTPS